MTTRKAVPAEQAADESTPGMTVITLVYSVLFLLGYLFFFYMVYKRWPIH